MSEQAPRRRLAAILAADVVGYSRLMEQDEAGTMAILRGRRKEVLKPLVARHHGRIFKVTGDGVLIEFGSAVDAVECAVDLQRDMAAANGDSPDAHRIMLRIGVNLGDVMIEGSDLYGDGVNIAARLEALAEPGGVVVARTVFNHVRGKVKCGFDDLGEQQLKNIREPVRIYRLRRDGEAATAHPTLALPDKPSIAVLPFENLSGDPKQDYFADGMVDDIVTALSRFRNLFVIARNSSFAYKDRAVDVKQVGRELGVRYLLEGSVRWASERIRIAVQLIDASSGAHLWADRFDSPLADIFELQDQVATNVVVAIAPRLQEAEIERAKRKPTGSLEAYDFYLRALVVADRMARDANDEALQLFTHAIDLDSDYALAHARAAHCYVYRKANGWMIDRAAETTEAGRLARRAVYLAKDDAVALCYGGFALAYVVGDFDDGAAFVDRALALNSNLAAAWGFSGWMSACLGEPDIAIRHALVAVRLSPLDPRTFAWEYDVALGHFCAGRYDDAVLWGEKSLRNMPNFGGALRLAAGSYALVGRFADAKKMVARLRQLDPGVRVSLLDDVMPPFRRVEDRAQYVEGLRKAGLPE
jgi:TolB-like protein/tetratricopeptide (TPR) repeat protein